MSKLITLGSGSSGNAYILECENESLLLECGISFDKIKIGLNFDLSKIVGCVVTHGHNDHLCCVKNILKAGIPVYSTKEVQLIHPRVKVPKMGVKTRIGGFLVQPLEVPHSCECYAYIITHQEFGKLLFFTDCSAFKYKVKGCNHILAECNYSDEILISKMCDNELGRSLYGNHLELEDCVGALKANFGADTQSITLIHLSDSNSNEVEFVQRVKDEFGFENVSAAFAGQVINLEKEEF
jgi:phosphoribosyl 1,2-cyclic phosphodiesterase